MLGRPCVSLDWDRSDLRQNTLRCAAVNAHIFRTTCRIVYQISISHTTRCELSTIALNRLHCGRNLKRPFTGAKGTFSARGCSVAWCRARFIRPRTRAFFLPSRAVFRGSTSGTPASWRAVVRSGSGVDVCARRRAPVAQHGLRSRRAEKPRCFP
jgi:hypothetical protein